VTKEEWLERQRAQRLDWWDMMGAAIFLAAALYVLIRVL